MYKVSYKLLAGKKVSPMAITVTVKVAIWQPITKRTGPGLVTLEVGGHAQDASFLGIGRGI